MTAFPLKQCTPSSGNKEDITHQGANVVHYIAGYVCRKVQTKIEQSSRTSNSKLLKCVEGLLAENVTPASADLVSVVGRVLLHVKEGTYMLFCAVE